MQNNSTWAPSAPSPIVWPAKAWNVWLTIAVAIGAVFVAFVPALGYTIFEIVAGRYDPQHMMTGANIDVTLTGQVITYLPVALYFAAVLPPLSGCTLQTLGFRMPSSRAVLAGVLGTIAMFASMSLVSAAIVSITHHQDTEIAIELLKSLQTDGQKINFILVAVVLAPMVEELVFRVYFFNFLQRYSTPWIAMILSATVFGLFHILGMPKNQLGSQLLSVAIPLAVGGFVLAYVYAKTRNYWASVITHVLFNAIGVTQVLYFHATT